jgi:NitT/TauT family transport system permease protein
MAFASLAGIRVVEMSHMIMGPSCGMFLAMMGALMERGQTGETADMMVALFVLMVAGVVLALLIRQLQTYLLRWQSHFSERN